MAMPVGFCEDCELMSMERICSAIGEVGKSGVVVRGQRVEEVEGDGETKWRGKVNFGPARRLGPSVCHGPGDRTKILPVSYMNSGLKIPTHRRERSFPGR